MNDNEEIDRENHRPLENQASLYVNPTAKKVSQTKESSKSSSASTKTKSLLKVKSTQRSTDADWHKAR